MHRSPTAENDSCRDLSELLAAVARGDGSALARVYDGLSRTVYGLAFRILGDAHTAEEVTLDTFHQVWLKAGTYEPARASPRTWILALARNRAIDRLRSAALRRRREEPIVEGFDAVAREAPPDSWSMEREQELWILRAVAALPRDQSRAIELAFFRGLTHVEIAERLGQPLGTVKTRIRLAMTKLRGLLRSLENRK